MSGYILSPSAQADLDEVWEFSAERWGEDRAERYVRDLWRGIERIAANPSRGRACDDVRTGYRKYTVRSHVLFYRSVPSGIDVVRILHQSMDFKRHLRSAP
jgi:toxin ParE1/3/4